MGVRGCGSELRRGSRRQAKAALLVLVFLLVAVILVTTSPAQATRGVPRQTGDLSVIREGSPQTSTYWAKTYGGATDDQAYSVQQTSDGGYIVAGYTHSFGAGSYDFWVLKLNSTGLVEWQKTYGGRNDDLAQSIEQTSDGGYILAGGTASFGAGGPDFWLVKLGADGDIIWDAGSVASTQTTSAVPSDSSAAVSTTSLTPADSVATVQDTQVTARDSNATVAVQSSGIGLMGQEILLIIIVGLAAVVVVAVALVAVVLKKKRNPTRIMQHKKARELTSLAWS